MIISKDIQNNEAIPLNKKFPIISIKNIQNSYYFKISLKKLSDKKFWINLFFFISYLLYYISLEKCLEGMDVCPRRVDWMQNKIKEIFFSCLIMVILIELIIYKRISKLHLIHIIISYILFYSYSHGIVFEDHGYYNFALYFILFIIFFILFLPINVFIYLIQKKKKKISNQINKINKII